MKIPGISRDEFFALKYGVKKKSKKNKYHAVKRVIDNYLFHSIVESDQYLVLKFKKKIGIVNFFLMQVPLHLPGGVKLIVDFLVFYTDGTFEFIDVKGGKITEAWRCKQRIAEAIYNIKITIVRREEVDASVKFHRLNLTELNQYDATR